DQAQPRARAPVPQEPRLDVLGPERLAEQRGFFKGDLAGGGGVGGAPTSVGGAPVFSAAGVGAGPLRCGVGAVFFAHPAAPVGREAWRSCDTESRLPRRRTARFTARRKKRILRKLCALRARPPRVGDEARERSAPMTDALFWHRLHFGFTVTY